MAGRGDREIDDTGSLQVPLCPSRANVVKLLEVEQRRDAIQLGRNLLERRAEELISDMRWDIFKLSCAVNSCICQTTQLPPVAASGIIITLLCLFAAVIYILTGAIKLRVTEMLIFGESLTERHQKMRLDARILMEMEKNRKKRLAADVLDNSEGPILNMDSFLTRTKSIYNATDFYDLKKSYHERINLCRWLLIGGICVVVVLVCFMFWHKARSHMESLFSLQESLTIAWMST